jgi:hypothetical protein
LTLNVETDPEVVQRGVRPWVMSPDLAERLWLVSEKLTGVSFPDRP